MKRYFVDTDLWIYAHLEAKDGKREKTIEVLEKLYPEEKIIISIQVLEEFKFVLLRKYSIPLNDIEERIRGIVSISEVVPLTYETYKIAKKLAKRDIGYWDSYLVASSIENSADFFLTDKSRLEGRKIMGVKIVNPLKD